MDMNNALNIDNEDAVEKDSLISISMREAFLEWLSTNNTKKFSPTICVSCLDKISEYVVHKRICNVSLWHIMEHSVFKPIYLKVLEAKLLRVTDRSTHKVFIVAGQLYLKFLIERPWFQKDPLADDTEENSVLETRIDRDNQELKIIEPENVIAWLVIQTNSNGTLYLENVVRQYMSSLRSAPMKLNGLSLQSRDVFACHTVAELTALWNTFKTAPNYKQVNNSTSGAFSAGLRCYTRYLEHLAGHNDDIIAKKPLVASEIVLESSRDDILIKTLSVHFPNGFRNNSPIELSRLRRFVFEDFNEIFDMSNEELSKLIFSCGTLFDDKVYIVGSDTTERIKSEVDSAIVMRTKVIFYDAFYEKHENWLFSASVISEAMLKDILKRLYPQFLHKKNYFMPERGNGSELVNIRNEVLRVWGEDVLLNYQQLSYRLPYVPINKIKNVLAQNEDFVWNAEGVYTHIGKVDITEVEKAEIINYVAAAYSKDGYSSLNDVPLGEIEERNFELSTTAIHNAVFAIVLADKYDRRGKIITRKGDALDALSIMKDYCRSLEKCSLRDLLNFERTLTGETHRWIPMEAGYSIMVRTDEEVYVAEKLVHFDVYSIDTALDKFMIGEYQPLKSITTFAAFPHCGQAWNLFLLESYCRRFSDRFRFELLAVNSRNAGVIVRKECSLSYIEIMADAVATSNISLEKDEIEDFLCCNGYIGRRSYSNVSELIKLAKAIRKRRD